MSGQLRVSARNDNSEMTVATDVLRPAISEASWASDTIKYGREVILTIKTEDAFSCMAVIRMRSNAWHTNLVEVVDISESLTDDEGNEFEGVQYCYTPTADNLKANAGNEIEVTTDIWLVRNLHSNTLFIRNYYLNVIAPESCNVSSVSTYRLGFMEHFYRTAATLNVKKTVIAIDPGHGDHHNSNSQVDPGAVNGDDYEKDWALDIALELRTILLDQSDNAIAVIMTREGDVENAGTRLQWRMDSAEGSEMFISIHLNSATAAAKGYEVLYKSGHTDSQNLANDILDANTLFNRRSVKSSTVHVLREYNSGPSVLVEAGFISNSDDLETIKNNTTEIAQEIADGIFDYLER